MSTDLIIPELDSAIPSLASASKEERGLITKLFESLYATPEGMEEDEGHRGPDIVKIRQSNTKDQMLPADAKEGAIWSAGATLWQPTQGKEDPWLFVPIYRWISNARFQVGERSPDCKSDDGKHNIYGTVACDDCPDQPWRDGEIQLCRRSQNYIVVPLDFSGVYHVQFSKTSFAAGSVIAKTARKRGTKALWENVFGLSTKVATNKAGQSWSVLDVTPHLHLEVTPAASELGRIVYTQYKEFREQRLASQQNSRENADMALREGGSELSNKEAGFDDSM